MGRHLHIHRFVQCWPYRISAMAMLATLLACMPAWAQGTYYVRPDGGSFSQCTGLVNAPYPGSGSGQPCAWNHPFQALPPGGAVRISGGDTLIVASGSYRMGLGAPGADTCEQSSSWDCHMPPLPSGPSSSQPTRLVGAGWDSGCTDPPELWGAERPWFVLNLTDSGNLEVACLEVTDHSSCIEDHATPATRCERTTPPFGDWAAVGLYAEDSVNVHLADLDVHGLASIGVHAGRLTDWTVERVRINGNGWAGWDGDLSDGLGNSNSGDLVFRQLEVGWNGCAEDWTSGSVIAASCWGQTAGGYGDGFAAGESGGTWMFEDCLIHHNTSDGVDLLYLDSSATTVVRRLVAEGNAGNQLKVSGDLEVENSLLVGNCAFFEPLGGLVDHCRAAGNALAMNLHQGSSATVHSLTITGEGDCLAEVACESGSCNGSETALIRNVLFAGNIDWFQPWENTCLYWYDDSVFPADPVDFDYNLVWNAKDNPCPGASSVCNQDPLVTNDSLAAFDGHLLSASPAINAGTTVGAPLLDLDGNQRDVSPDIGAYEFGASIFRDGFETGDTTRWSYGTPLLGEGAGRLRAGGTHIRYEANEPP